MADIHFQIKESNDLRSESTKGWPKVFYLFRRNNENRNYDIREEKTKLDKMDDKMKYRIFLSILFGILGFIGSFFSPGFHLGLIQIHFVWSMVFPLCLTLAWGMRYGVISMICGLSFVYPFFLWKNIGYVNIITSVNLIIWVVMQGKGMEKSIQRNKFYYNKYFIQLLYTVISNLLLFIVAMQVYKMNFVFPEEGTIDQSYYNHAWFMAVINSISEFFVISICDTLLLFNIIRRMLSLESKGEYDRINAWIIIFFTTLGTTFTLFLLLIHKYLDNNKYSLLHQLLYLDKIEYGILLLELILFFSISGVVARNFQNKLDAENKFQVLWNKMTNSYSEQKKIEESIRKISDNFEAIIDSTQDLIWSVSKDYRIINMNTSLRKFYKEFYKIDLYPGMRIKDITNCDNLEVWLELYNRVFASRQLLVEYLQSKADMQFQVTLNPIFNDNEVVGIACFGRDITAQRWAEKEILMLNTELEQKVAKRTFDLQQSIDDLETFTNIVSHDLKAPLRSIDTYSRFIMEDHMDSLNPEVKDLVSKIHHDCINSIQLIEKLLSYSKTSRTDVCMERIDLKELIETTLYDILRVNPTRKVELRMENHLPFVMGDKMLMKQVIINIMANSVKFTRNEQVGIITVGCIVGNNADTFYFKDNGVGFDMEYSSKLFGLFERLHSSKEFEGNGIGLATISKIIKKHGGKTWIEGKVNAGATIYFTLMREKESLEIHGD